MNVLYSVEDGVARVTLDRPERLNAVDAATAAELEAIWLDLESRSDVYCVVITGAGEKAFCAGADMKGTGSSGLEYWAETRPNGFGGLSFRTSLDIPVIARVNGYALGGGFEMVMGCDIVVASKTARFGLPEARVGRMPLDGGMVLLQRKIPHNLAMGVMLAGRQVSAEELHRYGLVNEVTEPEALDDAVDAWVKDILAGAPLSLRAIKQTVNRTAHLTPAEAQALKTPALVAALTSEDAEEGVAAFREKRAPVWRGR
ncbi:enoyl-CoA hydratase/isomerase family protein [Hoeflea sp. WL0058]|uniref:Enoyl-CoA hydratase/isomerase family protein n=1 Tax=Flavimaribacter sediminis TaxID=2865987 RepID=A0AAE2ZQF8_9HYPH|nr:enoyl-CoA hydratase-related protein [Flavimaribacter sediminis]MBW8637772.1 enoyl-CoA hydratase/isomerase family protein [Flavimaribacter sediminis]